MKVVKGDIITLAKNGYFDIIVHGCNCFNTMGAGIALSIKKAFPEAYAVDRATKKGNIFKLGGYTHAETKCKTHRLIVVNAYTQYGYQGKPPLIDYAAVRSVFKKIKENFSGKKIAYPKIGAGLAGGDWSILEKIIDEELQEEDHTLVVLE